MKQPVRRKPVQIATNSTGDLIALCDDGSIWSQEKVGSSPATNPEYVWKELPQVPTGVDEDLKDFEMNMNVEVYDDGERLPEKCRE